jgi:hypothetical protein
MILDAQDTTIDTGVPRRLRVETVPGKATACIGVRRSGKSTCMFQIVERLLGRSTPPQNILHVNFFDDRLHDLRRDTLGLILEAYYSLSPEKRDTETVYASSTRSRPYRAGNPSSIA